MIDTLKRKQYMLPARDGNDEPQLAHIDVDKKEEPSELTNVRGYATVITVDLTNNRLAIWPLTSSREKVYTYQLYVYVSIHLCLTEGNPTWIHYCTMQQQLSTIPFKVTPARDQYTRLSTWWRAQSLNRPSLLTQGESQREWLKGQFTDDTGSMAVAHAIHTPINGKETVQIRVDFQTGLVAFVSGRHTFSCSYYATIVRWVDGTQPPICYVVEPQKPISHIKNVWISKIQTLTPDTLTHEFKQYLLEGRYGFWMKPGPPVEDDAYDRSTHTVIMLDFSQKSVTLCVPNQPELVTQMDTPIEDAPSVTLKKVSSPPKKTTHPSPSTEKRVTSSARRSFDTCDSVNDNDNDMEEEEKEEEKEGPSSSVVPFTKSVPSTEPKKKEEKRRITLTHIGPGKTTLPTEDHRDNTPRPHVQTPTIDMYDPEDVLKSCANDPRVNLFNTIYVFRSLPFLFIDPALKPQTASATHQTEETLFKDEVLKTTPCFDFIRKKMVKGFRDSTDKNATEFTTCITGFIKWCDEWYSDPTGGLLNTIDPSFWSPEVRESASVSVFKSALIETFVDTLLEGYTRTDVSAGYYVRVVWSSYLIVSGLGPLRRWQIVTIFDMFFKDVYLKGKHSPLSKSETYKRYYIDMTLAERHPKIESAVTAAWHGLAFHSTHVMASRFAHWYIQSFPDVRDLVMIQWAIAIFVLNYAQDAEEVMARYRQLSTIHMNKKERIDPIRHRELIVIPFAGTLNKRRTITESDVTAIAKANQDFYDHLEDRDTVPPTGLPVDGIQEKDGEKDEDEYEDEDSDIDMDEDIIEDIIEDNETVRIVIEKTERYIQNVKEQVKCLRDGVGVRMPTLQAVYDFMYPNTYSPGITSSVYDRFFFSKLKLSDSTERPSRSTAVKRAPGRASGQPAAKVVRLASTVGAMGSPVVDEGILNPFSWDNYDEYYLFRLFKLFQAPFYLPHHPFRRNYMDFRGSVTSYVWTAEMTDPSVHIQMDIRGASVVQKTNKNPRFLDEWGMRVYPSYYAWISGDDVVKKSTMVVGYPAHDSHFFTSENEDTEYKNTLQTFRQHKRIRETVDDLNSGKREENIGSFPKDISPHLGVERGRIDTYEFFVRTRTFLRHVHARSNVPFDSPEAWYLWRAYMLGLVQHSSGEDIKQTPETMFDRLFNTLSISSDTLNRFLTTLNCDTIGSLVSEADGTSRGPLAKACYYAYETGRTVDPKEANLGFLTDLHTYCSDEHMGRYTAAVEKYNQAAARLTCKLKVYEDEKEQCDIFQQKVNACIKKATDIITACDSPLLLRGQTPQALEHILGSLVVFLEGYDEILRTWKVFPEVAHMVTLLTGNTASGSRKWWSEAFDILKRSGDFTSDNENNPYQCEWFAQVETLSTYASQPNKHPLMVLIALTLGVCGIEAITSELRPGCLWDIFSYKRHGVFLTYDTIYDGPDEDDRDDSMEDSEPDPLRHRRKWIPLLQALKSKVSHSLRELSTADADTKLFFNNVMTLADSYDIETLLSMQTPYPLPTGLESTPIKWKKHPRIQRAAENLYKAVVPYRVQYSLEYLLWCLCQAGELPDGYGNHVVNSTLDDMQKDLETYVRHAVILLSNVKNRCVHDDLFKPWKAFLKSKKSLLSKQSTSDTLLRRTRAYLTDEVIDSMTNDLKYLKLRAKHRKSSEPDRTNMWVQQGDDLYELKEAIRSVLTNVRSSYPLDQVNAVKNALTTVRETVHVYERACRLFDMHNSTVSDLEGTLWTYSKSLLDAKTCVNYIYDMNRSVNHGLAKWPPKLTDAEVWIKSKATKLIQDYQTVVYVNSYRFFEPSLKHAITEDVFSSICATEDRINASTRLSEGINSLVLALDGHTDSQEYRDTYNKVSTLLDTLHDSGKTSTLDERVDWPVLSTDDEPVPEPSAIVRQLMSVRRYQLTQLLDVYETMGRVTYHTPTHMASLDDHDDDPPALPTVPVGAYVDVFSRGNKALCESDLKYMASCVNTLIACQLPTYKP